MAKEKDIYLLSRGERGVSCKIYFPKKIAYQGTIFKGLEEGLDEINVKSYLVNNLPTLLMELKDYPNLFNPSQYDAKGRRKKIQPTLDEAKKRIDMYQSVFNGWSMEEVAGVWLGEKGIAEERTQIIHVMFRFPDFMKQEAEKVGCSDVLRSIIFWCIQQQGNLDEYILWDVREMSQFIKHYYLLKDNKDKMVFAKKHFIKIARAVDRWRDDCALFTFGYIVKLFYEEVLKRGKEEEEIWVTSFFNLTLNIFKKEKSQSTEKGELL